MVDPSSLSEREIKMARLFRPLAHEPMTKQQAELAAQLLGLHWTSVYRLRRKFLAKPVATSLVPKVSGRPTGARFLGFQVEAVINEVLQQWLPKQQRLAHPGLDITTQVRKQCVEEGLKPPSRHTVTARWNSLKAAEEASLAEVASASTAPGSLVATRALEIVQIDHTQSDITVVDRWFRRPLGRPWLTVAIDIASRCVVAIYLSMERPNAATVALVLSRIVLPKQVWLDHLGIDASWPMHGIPEVIHLDNAAEFHGQALKRGCIQYGIELMYRPIRRPRYGGHVERVIRTLMERLKGLPGATGNSVADREGRNPDKTAVMTLQEYEQWLVLEVAQRYHHSEHRGLFRATPAGTWEALEKVAAPRHHHGGPQEALDFLVQFMPLERRSIQRDGLSIFYMRYWHPIFASWSQSRQKVLVRYHPEDLSRVFVSVDGRKYYEARYADLRLPVISLWEQRAALRLLKSEGHTQISQRLIFKAIEEQRRIVERARRETRRARLEAPAYRKASSRPAVVARIFC